MIVVDTSALMAVVLEEPEGEACATALAQADTLMMSAATLAEALIVAGCRDVGEEMRALIDGLGFEIVGVSAAGAHRAARAYARWGKGFNPAGLNLGDCFAYALASERDLPLLFVGNDFSRTDLSSAIPRTRG